MTEKELMGITVTPNFTETDSGEIVSDFSVTSRTELHRGLAPQYMEIDDATGEYTLDIEPTFRDDEGPWEYDSKSFERHPVLGNGTEHEAALYWMSHSQLDDAEFSALIDGLEQLDGADRLNAEMLIAFKQGDISFSELPIEIQEQLIEAAGLEIPELPQTDEVFDGEEFEIYSDLHSIEADSDLVTVFEEIANDRSSDEALSYVAELSALFHEGVADVDSLIEQAVEALGKPVAIDALYRLNELMKAGYSPTRDANHDY